MISSLRIKNGNVISNPIRGVINITSGNFMDIKAKSYTVTIGAPGLDGLISDATNRCPYVTAVSGVNPDGFGNLFLLGGHTSQVEYMQNHLGVCDMSQRDDRPIIFRAIYDMLRILRLWLDAHKDSLLLSEIPGNSQWDNMVAEDKNKDYYLSYSTDDGEVPPFMLPVEEGLVSESRGRSDIVAIGPALRLYNEYQSIVAMWNRLVKEPETIVEVRIHPGDNSGIYVGVTANIPLRDVSADATLTVTTKIIAVFSGQTGSNLYVWNRALDAYCRLLPRHPGYERSIEIKGDKLQGTTDTAASSKLDSEGKVIKWGSDATLEATYTETIDGSEKPLATIYTTQMVYEAIPFCLCRNETSYADSLGGLHYVSQEKNTWTIRVIVSYTYESADGRDTETVLNKEYTKQTIFAEVCDDPYPDKIADDDVDEETGSA